ncbi:hypothetical protein SLS54_004850 [Diplodia seriata]
MKVEAHFNSTRNGDSSAVVDSLRTNNASDHSSGQQSDNGASRSTSARRAVKDGNMIIRMEGDDMFVEDVIGRKVFRVTTGEDGNQQIVISETKGREKQYLTQGSRVTTNTSSGYDAALDSERPTEELRRVRYTDDPREYYRPARMHHDSGEDINQTSGLPVTFDIVVDEEAKADGRNPVHMLEPTLPVMDQTTEDRLFAWPSDEPFDIDFPDEIADNWGGSTYSSRPASVFSIASGFSAITTDTQYSNAQITSALHQLVILLSQHKCLEALIDEAIRSDSIGADRFCNNFRRLLKIYADGLKEEAGENLEFLAARLVRWKARAVANSIREKYTANEDLKVRKEQQPAPNAEEDESDDDEQMGLGEDSIEVLAPVQEFLLESRAFENFKTSFEEFVNPHPRIQPQLDISDESTTEPCIPVPPPSNRDRLGRLGTLLSKFRLTERPLDPGKKRVRWKCVSVLSLKI